MITLPEGDHYCPKKRLPTIVCPLWTTVGTALKGISTTSPENLQTPDKIPQTKYNDCMLNKTATPITQQACEPNELYDLAIIGTGPAGYTASIYASRYNLKNLVLGKLMGGQSSESHSICNFPGFPNITGIELAQKFHKQAQELGATINFETVTEITGSEGNFSIETQSNKYYHAKAILLATGAEKRHLNVPGETELLNKGVTYCATCDGPLYRGKTVAVVGGSDAANTASIFLSTIAQKVYQIYRKDQLRGEPAWVDQVLKTPNIEVIYNTNITGIVGKDKIECIVLDKPYNGKEELVIDGLFVEVGSEPDPTFAKQLKLEVDEGNFIVVTPDQRTSLPGVWAAGDNTTNSNKFHQIITAAAEGAVAAQDVFKKLKEDTL